MLKPRTLLSLYVCHYTVYINFMENEVYFLYVGLVCKAKLIKSATCFLQLQMRETICYKIKMRYLYPFCSVYAVVLCAWFGSQMNSVDNSTTTCTLVWQSQARDIEGAACDNMPTPPSRSISRSSFLTWLHHHTNLSVFEVWVRDKPK